MLNVGRTGDETGAYVPILALASTTDTLKNPGFLYTTDSRKQTVNPCMTKPIAELAKIYHSFQAQQKIYELAN